MTLSAGRLLAAIQGVIWFAYLLFGLVGLVFGPMAWIAAAVGRRDWRISVLLLLSPVAYLGLTWLPDLLGSSPADFAAAAALVLTVPAIAASGLIWWGGRSKLVPTTEADVSIFSARIGRVLGIWVALSSGLIAVLIVSAGVQAGGLEFSALPWQQFLYGLAFMPVICLLVLLPLAYGIDVARGLLIRRGPPRDIR